MALSHVAVRKAIGQLDRRLVAPAAQLIALIKPTFELRSGTLAHQPHQVTAAVAAAATALAHHGWRVFGQQSSPIPGGKGSGGSLPPRRRAVALAMGQALQR